MRREPFMACGGRATRSGAVENEAPQSSLHASRSTGADALGEVQSSPPSGPRAHRPVTGSTTRQLPCRFMALGVNLRNSMAVEFGL